jgi:hypothetical protein
MNVRAGQLQALVRRAPEREGRAAPSGQCPGQPAGDPVAAAWCTDGAAPNAVGRPRMRAEPEGRAPLAIGRAGGDERDHG